MANTNVATLAPALAFDTATCDVCGASGCRGVTVRADYTFACDACEMSAARPTALVTFVRTETHTVNVRTLLVLA